ncbi:MAG TPA: DNA-binding response regulator [Bacteroidales bacterium]|nr:DNA-binding response regulator [Bacteroidales bacterium]
MEDTDFKILLVDDEPDILEFLSYNLRKQGYTVLTAANGKEAIRIAQNEIPHLIILDVMMPEMDGIEACAEIRKLPQLSGALVVFLTARSEEYSQLAGFDAGADDYITKPIKPKIFLSKVKALLKRSMPAGAEEPSDSKIMKFTKMEINLENHKVFFAGEFVELPRKEFKLLSLLASKPEKVFTRDEIYTKVWGNDVIVGDRTIDVHIRKLREKFGDNYIKTIKGVGYQFIQP